MSEAAVDLFDSGRDPFSPGMLAQNRLDDGGTWTFQVPGEPVAKGRPKLGTVNGRAMAFTPKKTRTFESTVREIVGKAWTREPIAERPIFVRMTFVRLIPQSWPIKKRNAAIAGTLFPTGRPDLDNFQKAITDAMNTIVYTDDALIVGIEARKVYGAIPHAVVTLTW